MGYFPKEREKKKQRTQWSNQPVFILFRPIELGYLCESAYCNLLSAVHSRQSTLGHSSLAKNTRKKEMGDGAD